MTRSRIASAIGRPGLSARAYDKVLNVARTGADLAGGKHIGVAQAAGAVRLRTLDRGATCC